MRYEIIESIGEEVHSTGVSEVWLDSLPGRKDCEGYRELIEKFETIVRFVSNEKQLQLMQSDDDTAYIVSSPRKPKDQPALVEHGNLNSSFTTTNDLMTSLREVNYKLVRLIRSLKITKITQEVFLILQNEIGYCEAELNSRMLVMHETIERAFELIEILQLSEEQIASVQKRYDTEKHSTNSSSSGGLGADSSHCSNTSINNCLLDQETLQFIQSNPREFGLSNNHISYINGFTEILKKIKDTKQKKWDHYFSSCLTLWEKLGEDSQYIEEFVEINNLLTDQALMNFKMELQRLYLKRSEFIESFIVDSRGEIENLWGKLYYSQEQRQKFKYFENSSTCLDKESILNDHEMELKVLKQEYAEKIAIFDLYSQLDELIKDQNFLRESSKDSSRLLSKNSCKILLNEEKLRKKIHKNLPIVLKQLKLEIIKYNNEQLNKEGKPITIFGEDFFEKVILIESEQQQAAKPNRVKAKVVTTRSPTKGAPATNSNKITKKSSPATSKPKQPINRSPMYGTKSPMNRSPMNRSPMNTMSSISSTRSPITTKYSPYHQKPKYSDSSTMSPLKHTLKPLNTPLAASNTGNILDTSSISNTSKLSPLKTSFNGRYSISPAKTVDLDDKENSFCSKYSLSPIKITEYINGQTQTQGNSTVMNDNSTFDSSTVIGDDYQTWRTERIKQLNNLG